MRVMSTGYVSHWPKAAVPRSPDGKNNEKLTVIVKISRERSVYMDILVRNNTCAGLYAARFSWASLPCNR